MLTSPSKRDPQIDVFTQTGAGNSSAILPEVRNWFGKRANLVCHSNTVTYQCEEKEWQAL